MEGGGIVLKSGQYVFIHNYPPELSRSDLTNALLSIDDLRLRFIEFTSPGNVVIVVKSSKDKLKLLELGHIEVFSELNPSFKCDLKFYWGGKLPQPDPPMSTFGESPKWTRTLNSALSELIKYIQKANRIVAFTAEGLAEEIGIPDFRILDTVDWEYFNEFTINNVLNPEKAEIREKYWEYHTKLYEAFIAASPSPSHHLLRYLEDQNKLQCIVTQNIDGLHDATIQDKTKIIKLNGSELEATCNNCHIPLDRYALHRDLQGGLTKAPLCPVCNHPVKPSVVTFGEDFDGTLLNKAMVNISQSDLLLVLGSGLMLSPACQLLALVGEHKLTAVTVYPGKTVFDSAVTLALHGEVKTVCESLLDMMQSGKSRVDMDSTKQGERRMGARRSTGNFSGVNPTPTPVRPMGKVVVMDKPSGVESVTEGKILT